MKPSFLLEILPEKFNGLPINDIRDIARKLNFTMFCCNGNVYSVSNMDKLFKMCNLVKDDE